MEHGVVLEGFFHLYGAEVQAAGDPFDLRKILAGDVRDNSRVTVELKKGELVFESTPLKKEKEKEKES